MAEFGPAFELMTAVSAAAEAVVPIAEAVVTVVETVVVTVLAGPK